MKKIIINAEDATCHRCDFSQFGCVESTRGVPVCAWCGNPYLRDPRGHAFEPVYGPAKTFRASKYTPELPDRRIKQQPWPLIRERRQHQQPAGR